MRGCDAPGYFISNYGNTKVEMVKLNYILMLILVCLTIMNIIIKRLIILIS